MALNTQLESIIQPVVEGMGFELWGIEFNASGKSSCLRIYIDSEKGIDVEDCAAVSRQVSALLDIEDPISQKYSLEISSPGLDRPIFKLSQYEKYVGEDIQLALLVPIAKRRKLRIKLEAVEDNKLVGSVAGDELVRIPFHQIKHGYLVFK